jgi:hypothetical protein
MRGGNNGQRKHGAGGKTNKHERNWSFHFSGRAHSAP